MFAFTDMISETCEKAYRLSKIYCSLANLNPNMLLRIGFENLIDSQLPVLGIEAHKKRNRSGV
jgi:hypothetical protein